MAIVLGGVQLGRGLVRSDAWNPQRTAQTVVRTLGGIPVLYHSELYGGEVITLASLEDQGFQTLETVQQLYGLASVSGAQYLLDLDSIQYSVVFRHEEPPAFSATPIIPRTTPQAGDYFRVELRLLTV